MRVNVNIIQSPLWMRESYCQNYTFAPTSSEKVCKTYIESPAYNNSVDLKYFLHFKILTAFELYTCVRVIFSSH